MMDVQRSRNQLFDRWLSLAAISLTSCAQYGGGEPPGPGSRTQVNESAMGCAPDTPAKTVSWRGYTWDVMEGEIAGVAPADPNNVFVDAKGYLHLRVRKQGNTWTAAEMYTRERLGFGTYQWQIDAPLDVLDKNVVLGLFTYGPHACIGDDGQNEIDFEYSRWGIEDGPNVSWTNFPVVGSVASDNSTYAESFSLNGGTQTTSRFVWSSTSITDFLIGGYAPVGSSRGLLTEQPWAYRPAKPLERITQQPVPLAMNLWCFEDTPSDGKDVEVIIRDFQFVPQAGKTDEPSSVPQAGQTDEPDSNLASSATAYAWSANSNATADANRVESAGLNDGDASLSIPISEAGEEGAALWEAAGLLWTERKTISQVTFINGATDSNGNGYLQQSCSLQFTTDGTTWRESGWGVSPEYPYSTAAGDHSYRFSGPELQGVRGVRVSGQTGAESWAFSVAELRVVGR
jgi:hypothetical protein